MPPTKRVRVIEAIAQAYSTESEMRQAAARLVAHFIDCFDCEGAAFEGFSREDVQTVLHLHFTVSFSYRNVKMGSGVVQLTCQGTQHGVRVSLGLKNRFSSVGPLMSAEAIRVLTQTSIRETWGSASKMDARFFHDNLTVVTFTAGGLRITQHASDLTEPIVLDQTLMRLLFEDTIEVPA